MTLAYLSSQETILTSSGWDARSVDDWLRMGGAARIVHAVTEQGGVR